MPSNAIGGFEKITKRKNRSREEMSIEHSKKFKKPKRIDKRQQSYLNVSQDDLVFEEEMEFEY